MKQASELTNDELRILIAEDQGWQKTRPNESCCKTYFKPREQVVFEHEPPNYPTCLNAMHEAEKVFWTDSQAMTFHTNKLGQVVHKTSVFKSNPPLIAYATARQRAEAYVITRNLALP